MITHEPGRRSEPFEEGGIIPTNVDWFGTALRWIIVLQTHDVELTEDGPVATRRKKSNGLATR